MGFAGTTRVFIMDVEDLIEYETGMGELYDRIYNLINDRSDKNATPSNRPILAFYLINNRKTTRTIIITLINKLTAASERRRVFSPIMPVITDVIANGKPSVQ